MELPRLSGERLAYRFEVFEVEDEDGVRLIEQRLLDAPRAVIGQVDIPAFGGAEGLGRWATARGVEVSGRAGAVKQARFLGNSCGEGAAADVALTDEQDRRCPGCGATGAEDCDSAA